MGDTVYYRNWLMWLWKPGCSTICHLHLEYQKASDVIQPKPEGLPVGSWWCKSLTEYESLSNSSKGGRWMSRFKQKQPICPSSAFFLFFFLSFLFFGCTYGMWRCMGQRLNPCHSSDPSWCSDITGFLTCCTAREFPSSNILLYQSPQ